MLYVSRVSAADPDRVLPAPRRITENASARLRQRSEQALRHVLANRRAPGVRATCALHAATSDSCEPPSSVGPAMETSRATMRC